MVVMIDNYDSFTYNLVQYLGELGAEVDVYRNDAISVDEIRSWAPSHIVISPGPCTPNEAGISVDVVKAFAGQVPLLGVCLGHQCIAQAYGGKIVRARRVMHGKTSMIHHVGSGVFQDLPQPFEATRYHSLIVRREGVPTRFEINAWTARDDGAEDEIMGIRDAEARLEGVQFHPESILTRSGHDLLNNFLEMTA